MLYKYRTHPKSTKVELSDWMAKAFGNRSNYLIVEGSNPLNLVIF